MAMMIHELRSPLSVIRSTASLIIREYDNLSPDQIKNFLTASEHSAEELLAIVNDLLDVSKIELGKIELFKHSVDVIPILSEEVELYKNLANERGLRFEANFPEGPVNVVCDPDKIKHIMNNLISNSIKFTQGGSVTVGLETFHSYVKIYVQDTGIGVKDELKEKLFKKFVQARELPVSREKGTGLGLVIVKGIVEAHGGKVWIEDNQPHGARFVFTLPIS